MTDNYTAELHDLIDRAFTQDLGGRATTQMLHTKVYGDLPEHLIDFLVGKGLRAQVAAYFREQDDEGLPKRPAANAEGEHKQLSFFSVDEFMFVHRSYLERADANRSQADKVRDLCIDVHGVDIGAEATAS